jgi:hypothetical protein
VVLIRESIVIVANAYNNIFAGDTHGQKDAIVDRLMELHNKLQVIVTDYQILLQMLISFFKNLAEVSVPFNFKLS